MSGAPREAQQIFPIRLTSANEVDISRNTKIVAGNRVTVLQKVDPSPTNIVMAGVLHMSKQGKVYVPLCSLRSPSSPSLFSLLGIGVWLEGRSLAFKTKIRDCLGDPGLERANEQWYPWPIGT